MRTRSERTFTGEAMGALPSNSYRTRRMEQRCRGVYPLVVARRRSTAGRRGQKGTEERRSTVAPCRGGSNRTHTPFVATPSVSMVRVHSLGSFYSPREASPLSRRKRERERERELTPTRQQRLLTVDSIAGGVLMEAEICDLDELTSSSSFSIPRQVEPRRRRSASRALF